MLSLVYLLTTCKVNEKFEKRMHFLGKNVQKIAFKEYSLKKVEKSGGLWGKLITFAPKVITY